MVPLWTRILAVLGGWVEAVRWVPDPRWGPGGRNRRLLGHTLYDPREPRLTIEEAPLQGLGKGHDPRHHA